MNLLISFCNTETNDKQTGRLVSPLGLINTEEEKIFWLPVPEKARIVGITGLAETDQFVFAAYQTKFSPLQIRKCGLLVYEKPTLRLKSWPQLKKVKDPHAILVTEENVVITSTGNDRVIKYPRRGSEIDQSSATTIWTPSTSKGKKDTHHINSICQKNGDLLISAFGPKAGDLWKSAQEGYVINITSNRPIISPISHPHSLLSAGGHLFYCESRAKAVKKDGRALYQFEHGYTRGLAKIKNTLIIGRSSRRKVSKSTGIVNAPSGIGEQIVGCSVSLLDLAENKIVALIDLSTFHNEIFTVLPTEISRPEEPLSANKISLQPN